MPRRGPVHARSSGPHAPGAGRVQRSADCDACVDHRRSGAMVRSIEDCATGLVTLAASRSSGIRCRARSRRSRRRARPPPEGPSSRYPPHGQLSRSRPERSPRHTDASATCSPTRRSSRSSSAEHEVDFSYAVPGLARFRVNAFRAARRRSRSSARDPVRDQVRRGARPARGDRRARRRGARASSCSPARPARASPRRSRR